MKSHSMPNPGLGAGVSVMNKTDRRPALMGLISDTDNKKMLVPLVKRRDGQCLRSPVFPARGSLRAEPGHSSPFWAWALSPCGRQTCCPAPQHSASVPSPHRACPPAFVHPGSPGPHVPGGGPGQQCTSEKLRCLE